VSGLTKKKERGRASNGSRKVSRPFRSEKEADEGKRELPMRGLGGSFQFVEEKKLNKGWEKGGKRKVLIEITKTAIHLCRVVSNRRRVKGTQLLCIGFLMKHRKIPRGGTVRSINGARDKVWVRT